MSPLISDETTRPSRNRRESTPATKPREKLNPGISSTAPPSCCSKPNRQRPVATQRVCVIPKRAPSSRSSSSTAATHSPASSARESSSAASARAPRSDPVTMAGFDISNAAEAGTSPPSISARKRFCIAMIPSSPKASFTAWASNAGNASFSKSYATGASVRIVATLRESRASSICARRFSPILPLTSSAWAITSSRLPYCAMSALAFLGPMPGTPGMLSELSPLSP